MGARGPVGKPFELKVLEGNRGHRPLGDITSTFRPEVGLPTMPANFAKQARKAWKRLHLDLLRYNLLSPVYQDAFAALCRTVGRIELIERSLAARENLAIAEGRDPVEAYLDKTPNGLQVQSAVYQVLNREYEKQKGLLDMFGLNPLAAAKVTTAIRAQLQLFPGADGGEKPTPPGTGGQPTGEGAAPGSFADFN